MDTATEIMSSADKKDKKKKDKKPKKGKKEKKAPREPKKRKMATASPFELNQPDILPAT